MFCLVNQEFNLKKIRNGDEDPSLPCKIMQQANFVFSQLAQLVREFKIQSRVFQVRRVVVDESHF